MTDLGKLEHQGLAPARPGELDQDDLVRQKRAWLRHFMSGRFAANLQDERRCIQPHVFVNLAREGFFGLQIPTADGGLGLSWRESLPLCVDLGAADLSLAIAVGLHNVLGCTPLRVAATPVAAQVLRQAARGQMLVGFALTEPGAGSNFRNIESTLRKREDGTLVLNGEKLYIGYGSWGDFFVTFAQEQDVQGRRLGISAVLVEANARGFRVGPELMTMGMRGNVQNRLFFENVELDAERRLGEPGRGDLVAHTAMQHARLLIGAAGSGAMKRCLSIGYGYARKRRIITGVLMDNPVARAQLSLGLFQAAALDAILRWSVEMMDGDGEVVEELLVCCKIAGAEYSWRTAESMMQLLGGRGYTENNSIPRFHRDTRVLRIFEGPTETLVYFLGLLNINRSSFLRILEDSRMTRAAESLRKAYHALGSSATGPRDSEQRQEEHLRVGEFVYLHALLGAAERAYEGTRTRLLESTMEWLQALIERFRDGGASHLLSMPTLTRLTTQEIAEALGEWEPLRADSVVTEEWEVDPWLRDSE
jgi:alkylation response protein AidB-like acyl-CoA dehydrogenase